MGRPNLNISIVKPTDIICFIASKTTYIVVVSNQCVITQTRGIASAPMMIQTFLQFTQIVIIFES